MIGERRGLDPKQHGGRPHSHGRVGTARIARTRMIQIHGAYQVPGRCSLIRLASPTWRAPRPARLLAGAPIPRPRWWRARWAQWLGWPPAPLARSSGGPLIGGSRPRCSARAPLREDTSASWVGADGAGRDVGGHLAPRRGRGWAWEQMPERRGQGRPQRGGSRQVRRPGREGVVSRCVPFPLSEFEWRPSRATSTHSQQRTHVDASMRAKW